MHPILMTLFLLVTTALAATISPLHAVNTTRDAHPPNPIIPTSHLICGHFSTASHSDVDWVLHDLTSWPMDIGNSCTTPARTCRRVGCENTSAVYVCNDSNKEMVLGCKNDVADFAQRIYKECCRKKGKGQSGQIFNDERGYNVVVAYGNCNHGWDSDRPGMGPPEDPWGPNGECSRWY